MATMNWIFVDPLPWDYDVNTPLVRGIGGSQSALCYLAKALARRGHDVTTRTATTNPREIDGVRCLSCYDFPNELFQRPNTIVVVLSGPAEFAADYRPLLGPRVRLILWTGIAHDQPTMMGLCDPACVALWDRIVCVSNWQKEAFHDRLGVPPGKVEVLKNGIAPAFENLFHHRDDLAAAKADAIRLVYTSTPFRGLDVLLLTFPEVKRRHPECQLHVFSSLQVYNDAGADDRCQPLYTWCRATEGAIYHGSAPQSQLAGHLRRASILAYPSTFEETSCIAAMEAMAAGALVVTSDLGALKETCGDWGRYVPPRRPPRTHEQFEVDFVRALKAEVTKIGGDFAAFASAQFEQARSIKADCTWDIRAEQWEAAGAGWLRADG